jgi:hypothetical protein
MGVSWIYLRSGGVTNPRKSEPEGPVEVSSNGN